MQMTKIVQSKQQFDIVNLVPTKRLQINSFRCLASKLLIVKKSLIKLKLR